MKRGKHGKDKLKSRIESLNFQELRGVSFFGEGDDKWSAAEEMALLVSVEYYNCGNWSIIAKVMSDTFKRKFTADEIQDHYIKTYLEGDFSDAMNSGLPKVQPKDSMLVDHTSKEDVDWLNSADISAYENVPKELLMKIGYMPLREDYEMEYDATAEDLIKNLDFDRSDDDHISEEFNKNMKLILLDTYLNRLIERVEKKISVKELRLAERFYAPEIAALKEDSMCSSAENASSSPEIHSNSSTSDEDEISLPSSKNSTRLKKSTVRKKLENNFPFITIDDYPGSELLTEDEKELCTDLCLMPIYYISYRLKLIWVDSEKTAGRRCEDNLIPPHMTAHQCRQIVSFMERLGLLKNGNLLHFVDADY